MPHLHERLAVTVEQWRRDGSGRVVIVEIKADQFRAVIEEEMTAGRAVSREGRKALTLRRWEGLNPDRLKYQLISTSGTTAAADRVQEPLRLVEDGW